MNSQPPGRILVVDDQKNMRASTALLLKASGFDVREAASGPEALSLLQASPADLVLTDLRMEPMDGLKVLGSVLAAHPHCQVIVMTAYGSVDSAVEAMRQGAYDYIAKPFKEDELLLRVTKALERRRLLSAVALLREDFSTRHGLTALVGHSAAMEELFSRMTRVAPSDATVLIVGESGTGKELVARALHQLSKRRDRPFVPVNCAAITETLLESELFGHAKGAFTGAVRQRAGYFEEADGGTLFIDEITETTQSFQTKLLRVLQEGEVRRVGESTSLKVNVRTIAASNRDVETEVDEKRFRQDLYFRINVVTLRVPPLRERKEDIAVLAQHFLTLANKRDGTMHRLSAEALEHLSGHDFPGNVRELENLVSQAAALATTEVLGPADFPFRSRRGDANPASSLLADGVTTTLDDAVSRAEKGAIEAAVSACAGDLTRAAALLGVSSVTLWRKMKKLDLKAR